MRRLLTIPISHYCEKARWALDRAGLSYIEERHVQGIHVLKARRAGGGITVPVLVAPEGVYRESRDIVAYADARLPEERRLFPDQPRLRAEVEQTGAWLDAEFGPVARRLVYINILPQRDTMLAVNNEGVPSWEARLLRVTWPVSSRIAKRYLGIDANTATEAAAGSRAALDRVAAILGDGRPYLCGERFTAADLTFAALAAPLVVPERYGTPLPAVEAFLPAYQQLIEEFRAHPAGRFAQRLVAEHRPAPPYAAAGSPR